MGVPQSDITSVLLRRDQNTHTHTHTHTHTQLRPREDTGRR